MKITLVALALLLSSFTPKAPAQELPDPAAQYVINLKDTIHQLYERNLDDPTRRLELCKFIDQQAALEKMGSLALGRHKEAFSNEQWTQFLSSWRGWLSQVMDLAFQKFQNTKLTVEPTSRAVEDGFVVNVGISSGNNRPASRAQFFVQFDNQKTARFFDASLSGVRLMLAQRGEFDRLMQEGGTEAVLNGLKEYPACPSN